MFVARLGVAAGAQISVRVRPAEVVSKEDTANGKEEAKQETAQIYILFHSCVLSFVARRFIR
jgi:hypothetical protein